MKSILHIRIMCLIILLLILVPFSSKASSDLLNKNDVNSMLDILAGLEQDTKLHNKLDLYLKEMTLFDNFEHQLAIKATGIRFIESITKLSECIKEMDRKQQHYSSEWVKDIINVFDKKYILSQLNTIKFILFSSSAVNNMKYCEELKKNALYREIQYRDILSDYLRNLQGFSASLNNNERSKIADITAVVNSFLEGLQYPLQVLLSDEKGTLFSVALNNRKNLDPRLVNFFSTHPFFQKPFDPMKTFKELETLKPSENAD